LNELVNEIVLWDLPFKVREELYDIKGNEMNAVFVQREVNFKESSVAEWAYVFMEGVHVREQNVKRSHHVDHHAVEEEDDDDSSLDDL
jgi:hypothetical protein